MRGAMIALIVTLFMGAFLVGMPGRIAVQAQTDTETPTETATETSTATGTATETQTTTATATATGTPTRPIAYLPAVQRAENTPTPTITPTPFLSPTTPPTATAAPVILLQNGSFESGDVGWNTIEDAGSIIRTTFPGGLRPHGGKWAAWLGGSNNSTTAIAQSVTIPSTRKYLVYWRWIASADICYEDVGGAALVNDDGDVTDDEVVDATELCSKTNTGGWKRRSIDVSRFAGQTRTLIILVSTDGSLNSNMFVDDVSFQSKAGVGSVPESVNNDPGIAAPLSERSQHTVNSGLPLGIVEQIRMHVR